ncbi:MAG: MipA/OmpV family protein, partial [Pseudomonadota bacterium]
MIRHMIRALAAATAFVPAVAMADGVRIGASAVVVPQFEGSSDYRVVGGPTFGFNLGLVSVQSRGLGVEADLFASRAFDAGLVLRYNGGRDPSNIDNVAVSALPQVDGSAEVGAFAQFNYPIADSTFISPRVLVAQGLDGGHEGLTATGSVGLTRLEGAWTFGGAVSATYADDTYMNSFFSVGAASPSGLAAFTAGSGIKDIGVTLFASYDLNENWSVNGVAGVSRLVGDAADSPIVATQGNATQGFV